MSFGRRLADRLILLAIAILLWQAASLWFGAQWLSTPLRTGRQFLALLVNGEIVRQAQYTIEEALFGFLVGGGPAVILPFALRRSPTLSSILDPYLVGGYGVPKLALAPLFILWFGIGVESKVALVASVVFFVIFFNTAAGVQAVDVRLVQMARVAGASEADVARHIVWPGAVPYIFAGFRISAPYAIGAAVVGELISSNRGLGYMVQAAATDFDPGGIFVALIALTIVVVAVNWGLDRAERRILRWRPAEMRTVQQAKSVT